MADEAVLKGGSDSGGSSFKYIRKRDGRVVAFEPVKITDAIFKAVQAVGGSNRDIAERLTPQVIEHLLKTGYSGLVPAVEEVQDAVEKVLIEEGHARTAKAYILYRDRRTRIREAKSELMDVVREILVETSRENGSMSNSPEAKMMQIAMAASKKYYLSNLLPKDFARAHREASFHIHDLDYYSKTLNNLQIDLLRLLKQGFDSGGGYIRPPKRIYTAAAQAAVILQNNQNDMFGEQGYPHFDRAMGEVMRSLREQSSDDELYQAMEGLIFNLNALQSRSGARSATSSINLGTDTTVQGRAVTASVLKAFYRGLGRGENSISPHIVFRIKKGINFNEGDPNFDLYCLALKAASCRENLTFSFMDSTFNGCYGDEVAYMGCCSRVINNRHGPEISAGRGNFAFTTLNLPRLALDSRGSHDLFLVELDRLMLLAARQLLHRFEVISRLRVRDLPFLMGEKLYLGSERLAPDDLIGASIKNSNLALGFTGLAETLQLLLGKDHGESDEALQLGLKILDHMSRRCEQFCEEYDLNYSLLATPAGAFASRFTRMDRERFGIVQGVTDQDCYTASFHLPANCELPMAGRIAVEGRFHRYCKGGHISHVRLDAAPHLDNIEIMDKVIRLMAASDMGCGGINFPAGGGCRI